MAKGNFLLGTVLVFFSILPALSYGKEYSQIITVNDYTYEIEVGGTRDPVNETIIIENLGDKPLVNPRITVNGKYDWFDAESIAREATQGCATDEERAFSIFNFVRGNSQHLDSPGDHEALNPVVYFNVYGYANCAFHASNSVALARALGMKARVWEVWQHTVNEYWYNNAWHMIDSDVELYYLMNDNRTIASMEQLWADQKITGGKPENAYLSKFSHRNKALRVFYTDIEGNPGHEYQDGKRERGWQYFIGDDYCYVQTYYDYFTYEPHTMAMTLRPSEKLIRNWKAGAKYYDYKRHNALFDQDKAWYRKPYRPGDGQIIWTPDLKSKEARSYLGGELDELQTSYLTMFSAEDGIDPALHVKYKHGGVYDSPSFAMFSIRTPYSILGGKLKAKVYRGAAKNWDRLEIMVGGETRGGDRKKVWEIPAGTTGSVDVDVNLDETLYPAGERGRHVYTTRFEFSADEKNDPPTQTGVESLQMIADIQCSPNSLPALSLGENIVRYRDETPGPHKVKITHIWRERDDNHPPQPSTGAVSPAEGGTAENLAPQFKWKPAIDKDKEDKIATYFFTISFDPQCRWPLATALQKETGSSEPEWNLPEGWLNKDTTYYWRVKARDSREVWGDWSPVFRFRTAK